jgi:hypothetical protein
MNGYVACAKCLAPINPLLGIEPFKAPELLVGYCSADCCETLQYYPPIPDWPDGPAAVWVEVDNPENSTLPLV